MTVPSVSVYSVVTRTSAPLQFPTVWIWLIPRVR
jgi:hypothetical protein